MLKFLIKCLTIFGFLMSSFAYAVVDSERCRSTIINLMSAENQKTKNKILCEQEANYFRECSDYFLKENLTNLGLQTMQYLKEVEMLKSNQSCKQE